MTDIYSTVFGLFGRNATPEQRRRARGDDERFPFPMGAGAYIGAGSERQLNEREQRSARLFSNEGIASSRGPTLPDSTRGATRDADEFPFPVGPGGIAPPDAIGGAVRATGAPREYLDALITHESGGRSDAKARTSSATGTAQFTEDTWISMMRRYGARYGAEGEAAADGSMPREQALRLRLDPGWSALMAAHFAEENAAALRARIGRSPREGEVYLAHFLGDRDAGNLINAASRGTRGRGHSAQPATAFVARAAVEANPTIFYEGGRYERRTHPRTGREYNHYLGGGRARSAREVIELQSRRFRNVEYRRAGGGGE